MSAALAFAGASMGLQALSGLFGEYAANQAAAISESRGRMLAAEANADAERFALQAARFGASQKVSYLKSGVTVSGSVLDVLDETARTATEQIHAIQSRGAAEQIDANNTAASLRSQGRAALLGGLVGGASTFALASYNSSKNSVGADTADKTGFGTPRSTAVTRSKVGP